MCHMSWSQALKHFKRRTALGAAQKCQVYKMAGIASCQLSMSM